MSTFARRLTVVLALLFVLWAHDTLLLLFAGVLGAIVLRTAAVALARVTRMPTGVDDRRDAGNVHRAALTMTKAIHEIQEMPAARH